MKARAALRAATAPAHLEVDGIFSAFNIGRIEGYKQFLLAQAGAFLPVEAAIDSAGAAEILPDWPLRRRGPALKQDLEALGLEVPIPVVPPFFGSAEALFGGIYVLEGSRLGGALLSRKSPEEAPKDFLRATTDSARWRKLLEDLEIFLYRPAQVEAAVEAANQVFACFAKAGRRQLEIASA